MLKVGASYQLNGANTVHQAGQPHTLYVVTSSNKGMYRPYYYAHHHHFVCWQNQCKRNCNGIFTFALQLVFLRFCYLMLWIEIISYIEILHVKMAAAAATTAAAAVTLLLLASSLLPPGGG